jgi:predicted PurR-regulated permease PerM
VRNRQGNVRPVWQSILIGATALFVGLGLLGFVWTFARPLALAILSITIAAGLAPLVRWIAHLLPRVVAIALVYLILFLLIGGLVWLLLPSFSSEMQGFRQRLPQLIDQAQQWVNERLPVDLGAVVDSLRTSLNSALSQLVQVPVQFASALLDTLLVIFLSLYALVAVPKFRDFVGELVPEDRRAQVEEVMVRMAEAMGGYVRGVFISGLLIAVLTYVGLWIIGVEFRLALAVISGVLEIVPVFGSIIAGALIVAVALFQSVSTALIALIFVIVLQQVESNIITPLVLGHETKTSPFLNLLAFFAGAAVGGLVGALVAVPLAAALHVFVRRVVAPAVRRWLGDADGETQPVDIT